MQDLKSKIGRYYKENEMKIWVIVIVFILAIIITQTLNNKVKEKRNVVATDGTSNSYYNHEEEENIETIEDMENTVASEKIISDPEKEERLYYSTLDTISTFVKSCNSGMIEYAYELVSEECKKEQMPTIEDFKTKYYNIIFDSKKSYKTSLITIGKNDITVICIDYFDDFLTTGEINDENKITDYIIGIKENDVYKLKLLGYSEYMEMENNQ